MIDEILESMAGAEPGQGLNRLADEFRRGRNVEELMSALESTNSEVVSLASWILSELPFELYDSVAITSSLQRLTAHDDPAVRFHALSALYPSLRSGAPVTRELLERLRRDPNEGVRLAAEAAASRLLGT
jgi:HEAT repeat protein